MTMNPKNNTLVVQHLAPVALAATNTPSAGVDCEGFEHLQAIAAVGVVGASATIDVTYEESDASGSGFAAITGAAMTQIAVGVTGAVRMVEINLRKTKRYVRAVSTYGGSGTAVVGHIFVLHGPRATRLCTNTYDAAIDRSG